MINSGSVKLNGKILNGKNQFVTPQKRNIGFVFQDYPLFPHLNLKDNILFNLNSQEGNNKEHVLPEHLYVNQIYYYSMSLSVI